MQNLCNRPPNPLPGGDSACVWAAKPRRRSCGPGMSRAEPVPQFLLLPSIFKLCLVGATHSWKAEGAGQAPAPWQGITQPRPLSRAGVLHIQKPLPLWGQEFDRSYSVRGGVRERPLGAGPILGCLLQIGTGNLFEITSKAGPDAAVPTSHELWFWSMFDFQDCRKSPSRVYRRVHFTAEKIQTARINHGQEHAFLLHLPICGCFIIKNLTCTQCCT